MNSRLCAIMMMVCAAVFAYGQQEPVYHAAPLIVTANRYPTDYDKVARSVTVLTAQDIAATPANTIQDILAYVGGMDLTRRGPEGVQAEAGIRGGSFEETLVLIDGIRVTDPQTAHFNLDLPLVKEDIERIEVLRGGGSGLYGADAFAGIVHIITKKTGRGSHVHLLTGDFGLVSAGGQTAYNILGINLRLNATTKKSAGYTPNTDFTFDNYSLSSGFEKPNASWNFFVGYTDKDFGANSFYSADFPDQHERTKTLFVKSEGRYKKANVEFIPKLYWRRHDDDYILDFHRPDWYHNIHTTHVNGVEFPVYWKSRMGFFSLSGKIEREILHSNSLGNRSRTPGGLSLGYQVSAFPRLTVNAALFCHYFSEWGWKSWPGIDLLYDLFEPVSVYASIGRSFRMPSFTELYYASPANIGNPNLYPSEAENAEIGLNARRGGGFLRVALFRRLGKNMIDWARQAEDEAWRAMNITQLTTQGLEVECHYRPTTAAPLRSLFLSATFLATDKMRDDYQSKYVLNYLSQQVACGSTLGLLFGVEANLQMQWKKRYRNDPVFLSDLALHKRVNACTLFVKANNLFDASYFEVAGVPMPGRWISGGLNFDFASRQARNVSDHRNSNHSVFMKSQND